MLAYVLVRRGGYSVKEMAEYFGRDATTIRSLVSRYEQKMQTSPSLAEASTGWLSLFSCRR